jgi:hypothetical protein
MASQGGFVPRSAALDRMHSSDEIITTQTKAMRGVTA